MLKDDRIRLQHMLDAAMEAMGSVQGRERTDLEPDHIWALGLVKCIEIIGEAASQVGEATRSMCSEIPWPEIVGMRNRLVHAYFDIDLDQVWNTVTEDLPPLAHELRRILGHRDSPE